MGRVSGLFSIDTFADFVILRSWSTNDGSSSSNAYKNITETTRQVGVIRSAGAFPVLVTPTPVGGSGDKEVGRLSAVSFVINGSHGGIPCNVNDVVKDPANPNSIYAPYLDTTGNSTHMSTLGYRTVGNTYSSTITSVIQSFISY